MPSPNGGIILPTTFGQQALRRMQTSCLSSNTNRLHRGAVCVMMTETLPSKKSIEYNMPPECEDAKFTGKGGRKYAEHKMKTL
jgi:hypothetical protein